VTARYLPVQLPSDGDPADWPVLGWAMLARATLTLDSLMELLPWRRAADASVLVRCLYEQVVTFAWIAIDPADHSEQWVRWDRRQRIKVDNDLQEHGSIPLLDPETRAAFEAKASEGPNMPSQVPVRAAAVDAHWSQFSALFHAGPADQRSMRGMYRTIYRGESQYVHAAVGSLDRLIVDSAIPGELTVLPFETTPHDTTPFTEGPILYALMLTVAEHALGLDPVESVLDAIFST
jgi:hypothetical protein